MTTDRRTFLRAAGVAGLGGIAGFTTDREQDDGYHFGVSMKSMGQIGLFVQGQAANWYTQDRDDIRVTIADGEFDAARQTEQTINLLNQGVDAILLNPFDARASTRIVEEAKAQDVPVMNFDTATLSEDILIAVLFGQYRGGEKAAERFLELLEERTGGQEATVITNVFNIGSTTSVKRLEGFTDNLPDSVEVVDQVVSNGTPEDAAPKMVNSIRANSDVDAIYSNNVGSGLGALQALDQLDMLAPRDSDDHVMAFGIDGGPNLNQRIQDGLYDFAIDQPLHFYAPISIELMTNYLDADKSADALPSVGDAVVPGEDLTIENKEVFGITPWGNNFWGPADVTEYEFEDKAWYPWVRAQSVEITEENAMAPYLYGTVAREYQENQ